MKIFSQAPFVRLLVPFIIGIVTAIYFQYPFDKISLFIASLFAIFLCLFVSKVFTLKYKLRWANGFVIHLLLFLSGYQLTILNTEKFNSHHFKNYLNNTADCLVKVIESPVEKEKSIKIVASVVSIKQGDKWKNTVGKTVIYFQKDSLSKNINYGDCIFLKAKFSEINSPQNPGEFDYKRYLAFHNIDYQAYIKSSGWFFTKINDGNSLIIYALSLREKLLGIFKENNIDGDEYAVVSALILGYEDKLDANLIHAYSATGALHVLSVSGLHVAIIYIVFSWLLSFLAKLKKGEIIKALLLIFLIWFYALLTGLSPSVLRATAMFSFIIVGKSFNRYTNIYNTLAVSCFLLLLIHPYMIMEVGFQLSYLAVLGIVMLQIKMYQIWETNNWLLDQVWKITTVSMAAQLVTFPLGLLYFHQFPNYFLFSNLLVIPISTLILYSGIALFVFSKIKILSTIIAALLKYLVLFLNESVRVIEHLPYAIFQGISISIAETWIIYLSMMFIIAFLMYNKVKYLKCLAAMLIVLLSIQCIELFFQINQKSMVVYNVPNASAFDFINGKQNVFYVDSPLAENESKMLFYVKHNWWNLGLDNQIILVNNEKEKFANQYLFIKSDYIQFFNKKIVVVSGDVSKSNNERRIKVNYLILSKNTNCKIADLIMKYDFDTLIIDSSNARWKADRWITEAQKLKINYHSVAHSGAFQRKV